MKRHARTPTYLHMTHFAYKTPRPLDQEVRSVLPTQEAAFHLNMKPQTLRCWACYGYGPLQPIRVSGRLGWPVDAIRRLVGATA